MSLQNNNLTQENNASRDTTSNTKNDLIKKDSTGSISGIYIILNKINNRWYVGSAKNMKSRWQKHCYNLRKNNHYNSKLQHSYNTHGKDAFEFHGIEFVDDSKLLLIEQLYLDWARLHQNECYNSQFLAAGGSTPETNGVKGKKKIHKGETEKMVFPKELDKHLSDGWSLGHSEKHKELSRIGGRGHEPWNRGVPRTDEVKRKLSAVNIGKLSGKDSPHYGKHRTEEVKQKIREKQTGKKMSKEFCRKLSERTVGSKNPRYDSTIYHFYNVNTKTHEYCTRFDLKKKFNLSSHISLLMNHKISKCCGWVVI